MEFTQLTELNMTEYTNQNFNQQGEDTTHDVIVMKCNKYPFKKTLEPVNILGKLFKWYGMYFFKMIQNQKNTILNCTCAKLPHLK